LMAVSDSNSKSSPESGPQPSLPVNDDMVFSSQKEEPKSWMPWIVAGSVVVVVLALLLILGHHSGTAVEPGGVGMAPAAPYAANLPLTELEMSQADSFSGAKATYFDGKIANHGNQTIRGVTVQVGFRNDLNQLERVVTPLSLIRTREPYVDTEPVSAAPLKPGDVQAFRLIFDSVPADWNQQLPEIRIIATQGQ
jgi:hypothetical protein